MTKLHELANVGQAIWLDYIRRSLITSGELQALVDKGLRGMTSNPAIFNKAISESHDYDDQLRELIAQHQSAQAMYEALVVKDIQDAADILRPVYDQTNGADGFISLEANPYLAYDTNGTMEEIRRLRSRVNRPNVMYKVPATRQGIPVIEQLTAEGININITLMFSMDHYEQVANAYLNGLEKFAASGGDISRIASVASFFVSRVDKKVDKRLQDLGNTALEGKIGIANAKNVYRRFKEVFGSERWQRLASKGGRVQRPLWASTSTKNPAYPDTLYVDNLIGPDTVNTLPPETLEAFLDHGTVARTVDRNVDEALAQLTQLAALGIDLIEVGDELQREGVDQFVNRLDDLMHAINKQREQLPQR
jgi:transaldolase